jgi:hypothetical protein
MQCGKLWRVGGGTGNRVVAKRECVTRAEAVDLAKTEHEQNGHWHRDSIKLALMNRVCSPGLDRSIVTAIEQCGKCRNFGGKNLHAICTQC